MLRIGIILLSILLLDPVSSPAAQLLTGRVSVTDGDTIEMHGRRIRLHGIDAPEGGQLCHKDGKPWRCGQAAAFALDGRTDGSVVSCRKEDVDRYGRIVATCVLEGTNLNEWMVREGWAMAYRRYSTAYVDAEEDARRNRRGIWQSEFAPPWEWRAQKRRRAAKGRLGTSTVPTGETSLGRACCKICKSGKPCGNSCITRDRKCRKTSGCAC